MTFEEFVKMYPEYSKSKKNDSNKKKSNSYRMKYLCQCKRGHMFDFRERTLYPPEDKHHAPCQGKCPTCGCEEFSLVDDKRYPIKWNFTK